MTRRIILREEAASWEFDKYQSHGGLELSSYFVSYLCCSPSYGTDQRCLYTSDGDQFRSVKPFVRRVHIAGNGYVDEQITTSMSDGT